MRRSQERGVCPDPRAHGFYLKPLTYMADLVSYYCLVQCTIHGVKCTLQDEAPIISDYREHHSDSNVHFVVEFLPGKLDELMATPGALEAKFKLQTKMSTSRWSSNGTKGK